MNVREFECRSYERAMELLGGKDKRTVCHNTLLHLNASIPGVTLCLHGHQIVHFRTDGPIMVDSRGYRTNTTKDRINRCLPDPWRLAQRNRTWHLWRSTHVAWDRRSVEEVPFVDGMTVPGTKPTEPAYVITPDELREWAPRDDTDRGVT